MRLEHLGPLNARITGGTDGEGGGDGPVVVLLHGFGAAGDDLVSLWRGLDVPENTRFVFPEAPIVLDRIFGEARAWWMIDWARIERAKETGDYDLLADYEPPGLGEARAAVLPFLDAVEARLGVDGGRLVLGGFSQGANLSTDVVLRSGRKLAGLVVMSGSIVCRSDWLKGMGARQGLPVFMSHGSSDAVLPYALAERARDLWISGGNPPEWVAFAGGHEIPWTVTEKLGAFLRRVF